MEQVLRTVSALNEASFSEVAMYETLIRPLEITQSTLPSVDLVAERLKVGEVRKEARRLRQIENARSRKRKRGEATDPGDDDDSIDQNGDEGESGHRNGTSSTKANATPQELQLPKMVLSKPLQEVRGHTSYLTFATLLPGTWDGAESGEDKPGQNGELASAGGEGKEITEPS